MSKMEVYAKTINGFLPVTVSLKIHIFDIWQGSEYASVLYADATLSCTFVSKQIRRYLVSEEMDSTRYFILTIENKESEEHVWLNRLGIPEIIATVYCSYWFEISKFHLCHNWP